ncbi:MAG: bifunctional 2',3'-cyclic-nucleotide 2'-phosphodiesterase/3'-nucleotidase [Acidocella sp.]|nr:bifunctional 2',3'-cyclic-nucleotide 2'-phosphodiesterase/3'-nucleotidase [Acidocella sp.]
MSTRRTLLTGLAATMAAPPVFATPGPVIKLRLLETSDLHTFDEDYDYFRDQPDESVGLTKVATLIHTARAEARNCLLFDNGDIIQGNPLADYVAQPGKFPADHIHPTIRAMNTLQYDAATLGNHEFNYGLDFCTRAIAGANFPFCCANIHNADGSPYLPPTLVLDRVFTAGDGSRHTLKIGVIGFVPPQIMEWDKTHLAGRITTTDIVDAAHIHVPALRAQVDILIALSHSGISTAPRRGGEENASYYLAAVPGIDIIFTGHSHRVFPGPDYAGINGIDATNGRLGAVPAIMPGFWGSELGLIDLTLVPDTTGARPAWRITNALATTRPIAAREGASVTALAANNQAVDAAVAPEHQQTLAWIREPIGQLTGPITSYFALLGGADPSLALVNAAQLWYAAPLLTGRNLPILSAAAPFKEGYQSPDNYIDLASGTIAIRDVADLYMYPNTLAAIEVDGAALRSWLEHAAQIFNRFNPNTQGPQPLLNPHVPSYAFDVIANITYEIDITQPARFGPRGKINANTHRIVNLRYRGVPVAEDQRFIVITNNYRADSGGITHNPADIVLRAPDQIRDIIIRYILAHKSITPDTGQIWSFAPIGLPALLTFTSAPAAARYLLRKPNITSLGDAGNGYANYALNLD